MTLRRMRIASWIPKATDAHSEYVIFGAFPLQLWFHERPSMLRYTYVACLAKRSIYHCNQNVGLYLHLCIPFFSSLPIQTALDQGRLSTRIRTEFLQVTGTRDTWYTQTACPQACVFLQSATTHQKARLLLACVADHPEQGLQCHLQAKTQRTNEGSYYQCIHTFPQKCCVLQKKHYAEALVNGRATLQSEL